MGTGNESCGGAFDVHCKFPSGGSWPGPPLSNRPARFRVAGRPGPSGCRICPGGACANRRCARAGRGAANGKLIYTPGGFRPLRAQDRARHAEPGAPASPSGARMSSGASGRHRATSCSTGNAFRASPRLPTTALQGIPAKSVVRIEIVDAAQVDVPGPHRPGRQRHLQRLQQADGHSATSPRSAPTSRSRCTRGDVSVSGTRGPVRIYPRPCRTRRAGRGRAGRP
jgi:hypothetical protein